ncbi:MAG: hypothetical protein JNK05_11855 [Myxococcales bacterium]|nr:hypothetical protein [Myxococcales bacterium]
MKHTHSKQLLLLCSWLLSACGGASITISGQQDGTRLAQSVPTPMGGRIGAGRLAASGTFRGDVVSAVDSGSGQRTPPFSVGASLGVGFIGGDAALDCRFAEAHHGVRTNPMLATANPHTGVLWRCGASLRYALDAGHRVQLLFGATLSLENALVHRDFRFTRTTNGFGIPTSSMITDYTERRVVTMFGASAHITAQYDPHRYVMLEAALGLVMPPTLPRNVHYAWSPSGLNPSEPTADALPFYEFGIAGMGWIGAAFGPEYARFAVRASGALGNAAAITGAHFGAEAALVVSTQVFNPGPRTPFLSEWERRVSRATRSSGTPRD